MSAVFFEEDPKYNGPHMCPGCGEQSHWTSVSADGRMINIDCEGECGQYVVPYAQLSDYPHFREDSISS